MRKRLRVPADIAGAQGPRFLGGNGAAAIAGSGGAPGGGGLPDDYIRQGPAVSAPPESYPFVRRGTVTITGPAVSANPGTLLFSIPPDNFGIIRSISIGVSNMLATTNIVFSLLINGDAVQGYENLAIRPRAAASVDLTLETDATFVQIPEAAQVGFRFNVIDAGTYPVGASYQGWYWPTRLGR